MRSSTALTALFFTFLNLTSGLALLGDALSPRACTNILQNAGFETGSLDPWVSYARGGWQSRDISQPNSSGKRVFRAVTSSPLRAWTILAQNDINLSAGQDIEVSATLSSQRSDQESVFFEIFVGMENCGGQEYELKGTAERKVEARCKVQGPAPFVFSVTVWSNGGGERIAEIGDLLLGVGC
ncbi:hypothetical protein BS50DRAFT_591733 [Corynespora cassiicola Philippines]|uniref:Ubiquitin 3 binding protein But2 C-terminal domain-containing protein n=1 Tax=Corynespora cassiicola Philippines TaxID=1448308 RepID=A0A2T2NAE9_CORCC|nr:hypothetical protein BS50DRAFT_591733 [Corynespora cassiicola Philippines]